MLTLIQDELQRFLTEDDGKPIVILNLLRFEPNGGRERWSTYTAAAGPILGRYGAEMVFVGDTMPALFAEAGQPWDSMALIRYPNRHAFANLANDPEYREKAEPLREAALQDAVVQPMRTVG
jgi:uncharacterized protein (DUF1330 family)